MCGIVAAAAERDITPILLSGLHALEYRGYDSAGFCVLQEGRLQRLRTPGKVKLLEELYQAQPIAGETGIAHTRWATHGAPTEPNAHPLLINQHLGIVHNGIIENHESLREELLQQGCEFSSETDTEVVGHLLDQAMADGADLFSALQQTIARLSGVYALAVTSSREPGIVVGARCGCPLVAGLGFGENYIASDIHALLAVTNRFIYLHEGDALYIDKHQCRIVDSDGVEVQREIKEADLTADAVQRGSYRHYMQKEIFEQPAAITETLEGRLGVDHVLPNIFGIDAEAVFKQVENVHIVACGTSYHAGLVARYQLELLAGIPCSVEVASEYRYRSPVVPPKTLFVTISQSGETLDTLAALRHAKQSGYLAMLSICNVPESSLMRESDLVLMTRAGPEIGVASTKAFTTQLAALQMLVLELARIRSVSAEVIGEKVRALRMLPQKIEDALALDAEIDVLAQGFAEKHHALFLGRGSHYPIALEGALKLKEISYIHAEAYPAGELKHGPLALVDKEMPVIAVAPNNRLLQKLISNIEEVRARGGEMIVFADRSAGSSFKSKHGRVIEVDSGDAFLAPIVMTVPLQLLAYHVALLKGTDVDQPRNLAKSVTVE